VSNAKQWWTDIPLDSNDDEILNANWRSASVPEGFRVVAVGDIIISHPIFDYIYQNSPGLIALLKSGNVTIGNYEGTAVDLKSFDAIRRRNQGSAGCSALPIPPPIWRKWAST
jgi:hypothetical protein